MTVGGHVWSHVEIYVEGYAWARSLALRGLRLTRPDFVIGLDTAVILGKHGGDRRSEAVMDQADNISLNTALGDAKQFGTSRAYLLARLERDRPDLATRVRCLPRPASRLDHLDQDGAPGTAWRTPADRAAPRRTVHTGKPRK